MNNLIIREIQKGDNPVIEQIIKAIFPEFNLPLVGTAFEDVETPRMFESYQGEKEVYFVVEANAVVLGGGGIKPLKGFEKDICELQKVYFPPEARGKGYGKMIFDRCLDAARDFGYKQCYLESASQMEVAVNMYEKAGYKHLEGPLGETGHFSCGVWMIKDLI